MTVIMHGNAGKHSLQKHQQDVVVNRKLQSQSSDGLSLQFPADSHIFLMLSR